MNNDPTVQNWSRTLVEVYKVKGDLDGKRLLELARSTQMNCEDFYTDEEDGYTGGKVADRSFEYRSGEMEVTKLELVGRPPGDRTLLRVSSVPFQVTLRQPNVPYEKIMFEIDGSISSERLTEIDQDQNDPDEEPLDLKTGLELLWIESAVFCTDAGFWEPLWRF